MPLRCISGYCSSQRMRAFRAHGWIVALSSVAGERVRRSNFVYGSTKAGLEVSSSGWAKHYVITAYTSWWFARASSSPR